MNCYFYKHKTNLARAKEMGERWVRDRSQAGVGELCRLELSDLGEDDELPDSLSALTTLGGGGDEGTALGEGDEGEAEPAVKKSSGVSSWHRGVRGKEWLKSDRGVVWLELLGEPALDMTGERRPGEGLAK